MTKPIDVLVAGAGPSGLMAALAAAREGASVRLIEQRAIPGGMNTAAMVGPLMGFHAGQTQVVRGLAQTVIDRLSARGATRGHIPDPLGVTSSITPVEPSALTQVYFDLLRETPGIDLRLGTVVSCVQASGGQIESIETVSKSGVETHTAKVFIDATGDADIVARAGLPFSTGRPEDGLSQPMTLIFKIGGVDFSRVRAYVRENPDQFVLGEQGTNMDYVAISGYFDIVREAKLPIQRDRVLLFEGVRPGEAIVNMTRVVRLDATNTKDLTRAEMEARAQVDVIVQFLRASVDGFAGCFLAESGDCIGVRESRHIHGQYTLCEADIARCAAFEDSIAMCAFPIDLHDPSGQGLQWEPSEVGICYDVPYRVMVPETAANLLVAGRSVSATHVAAASVRITPTVMAMGEAAGIAAAMVAAAGTSVDLVDIAALQARIAQHGGVFGQAGL